MTVFVTGANGLVGSYVVKQLLGLGYKIKILLRENADKQLLTNVLSQCEIVIGDILDTTVLAKSLEDCQKVVHCAGLVSFDPRKKRAIFETNVLGTANVVNASLNAGIQKLVHVSSIAALGRQYNSLIINEKTKWEDTELNSSYAKSKYLAELEVFRGGEEGLNFSMVNPSIILGAGDLNRSSTKLIGFIKKMSWCYPAGYLNVVDVRDVSYAICQLLEIEHKDRLVLNAECISYRDFYNHIGKAYGLAESRFQIPTFILRLVAIYSGIKTFLFGGEPIITKENIRFLNKKFIYESLYYSTLFGSKPISAIDSISTTISDLKTKSHKNDFQK